MIRSSPSNQSIVYSINGPWGGGKTSLANLVVSRIEQQHSIEFVNPWMLESTDQIVTEVLSILGGHFKLASSAWKLYQSRALIRVALDAAGGLTGGITNASSKEQSTADSNVRTLRSLKDQVIGELQAKGPLVLVVDDSDLDIPSFLRRQRLGE